MAEIAVITHHRDQLFRSKSLGQNSSGYMLGPILVELAQRGHAINVINGFPGENVTCDVAIMPVDLTRVPREYTDLGRSFPLCLNVRATDISKRVVSGLLVDRATDWTGPVIVKSNMNYQGIPELSLNRLAQAEKASEPFPGIRDAAGYKVFANVTEVPAVSWGDENLVVEKFMPEKLKDGFGVRFWTFLGNEERCDRCVSSTEFVKAAGVIRLEPSPVPARLREIREHMGSTTARSISSCGTVRRSCSM